MGQEHWKVDLNEFHIIQYEYKINDYEELVKNRTNMKLKSGKYMWSRDVVVIENKKVKVGDISSGKWDFDMNGFLGFWNEEGKWIYNSAIGFLRGFFLATIGMTSVMNLMSS